MAFAFFPASTGVCALPSWERPRVLFPGDRAATRWAGSGFFPAFRFSAQLYRTVLRLKAVAAPGPRRVAEGADSGLGDLVADIWDDASAAAVLLGTPGPAQKITAQLHDASGRVVGYVKYGVSAQAQRLLRNEYDILQALPDIVGPRVRKIADWQQGLALVTGTIGGRPVSVSLPPADMLVQFCERLHFDEAHPFGEHPWYDHAAGALQATESILAPLGNRSWPVAIQHGDLVPWNLRSSDGAYSAFDWEYADLRSFPYLDLCYFIFQTAFLIHRWKPARALEAVITFLCTHPRIALEPAEARSIALLSTRDAYEKTRGDGHADDFPIQIWRRAILEVGGWH